MRTRAARKTPATPLALVLLTVIFALLSGDALAQPAASNATSNSTAITNSSDSSIFGAANGSGSGPSDSNASRYQCNMTELEELRGVETCSQAPLTVRLNDTGAEAACHNANCTNYVKLLGSRNMSDCQLFDTTWLKADYMDLIRDTCNMSGSANNTGSGSFDNSTFIDSTNITNGTSTDSSLAGSSHGPVGGTSSSNSMTTVAIVILVVSSVLAGGLVTVFFVWVRSHRRKRRAAQGADSPGKDDQGPLTPSTQDGSGAQYSSAEDTDEPAEQPAPLPPVAPSANDAALASVMQVHLTTNTTTSSSRSWEDEDIIASRIPRDKITVKALVSRGGFGEVYQGTYNGRAVAIKSLLPEKRKNLRQINAFLFEVKLMAFLEHERIVKFVGVAWDSLADLCVLSEFMEGGDLRALLDKFDSVEKRPHGFDADKVKIALHIAHALTYLHSLQPIVLHRDLKSKNILLDSQLNAKLTDFGVSRERADYTMTAGVGTSLWMAPEVMMGERYDQRADMFSFGVVLSELDSHALPYSRVKASDSGRRLPVLQLVSLGRLKVQFSESVAPELRELGDACVSLDPYERPTAAEAMFKLYRALRALKTQPQQQ